MKRISSLPILVVEDEETDAVLLSLAFKRAGVRNPVHFTVDGAAALDYLAGQGPYANRTQYPLPALVLLDLKLPRKSGFEVLEWARQQPQFTALPIVIYTSSHLGTDRDRARQLGATDYVVKPANVTAMAQLAIELTQRWLLPSASQLAPHA